MGIIARPLGMLLSLIYQFVGSYGISIIIFTVLVKLVMYPLYTKQMKSSSKMADMQTKTMEIQQRYKNDKEMLNQKTMELYEKEHYNPMTGCLPMLIQMPIIFALFSLLRNPILYMGKSNEMLLAVHDTFLWMEDLSQPDLWILPIAAGISTFISFMQTSAQTAGVDGKEPPANKIMKYIFPVMIVYMGRSFPAGLTIYWFVNTTIQMIFNLRFNSIRKKMNTEAERKKMKKKK